MSDFDEEAEREKLRKRFAEEDEKREATERMSELLLQGATMTDTHCDTCGNPLFRYEGRTFCSTCQRPDDGNPAETVEDATGAAPAETPAGADGTAGRAADDGQRIAVDDRRDAPSGHDDARTPETTPAEREQPEPTPSRNRRAPPSHAVGDSAERTRSEGTAGTNDLEATEGSLSRTLRRLASAAEETDDLRRTREYLAAAREAADALAAVRTARR